MIGKFIEWSKKKYTLRQQILLMLPAGALFLLIMPAAIVAMSKVDAVIGTHGILPAAFHHIAGLAMIVIGIVFGLWSVFSEFIIGEGTPVPLMPTQKLITGGPFAYCRNPMAFGTLCAYAGIAVFIDSLSSYIFVSILAGALTAYIKCIEEKELEARFGAEYLEYKSRVPFILPRPASMIRR